MVFKNAFLKNNKKFMLFSSLLVILALALSACATAATSVPPQATVAPTKPAPTTAPTAAIPETGSAVIKVAQNAQFGNILTDSKGMTLYIFTKDTPGVSNCSGGCAAAWPPLTVPAGTKLDKITGITGTLGTITRSDGSTQVTINDMPLYTYTPDKAPGDTTGQAVQNVWWVVGPDGNANMTTGSN